MSRRRVCKKRPVTPDIKYNSQLVEKFINVIMSSGKKSLARDIVYTALERVSEKARISPLEVFQTVIDKVRPYVEVRSRRVGGATYQVPVPVKDERQLALAMRWLKESASKRSEKGMTLRLAGEMMDALEGRGEAVKKCIDTKKMADANQAFAHFASVQS
jgi:small subunit ribosomal protein S7